MENLPQVNHGGHHGGPPAPVPAWPAAPGPSRRSEFESQTPSMGPDFRFILRVLGSHKWLIAAIVVVLTGLSALGVSTLKDQYTSEALLLVDNRQVRVVREVEQVVGAIPTEDAAILSEIEILKSPQVLNQVVNDLQLAQHPEFNPPAQEDETLPLVERAVAYGRDLASRFWEGTPPAPVAWLLSHGDEVAQDIRAREAHAALGNDQIIARIHRKLDVAIVGRSRVIQVRFTSKEPQLSRDVVDGIVRRYMETRQQMDRDLSTSAISWLQDRIVLLRREVAEADSKVEEARVKGGLLKGGTGLMAQNELEQTRLRLSEASAIRARSVAQADTLERNLKAGNWNAIGGSIASPVVAQLRATVAAISTEMAQLSRQYGPKHPRIVELQGRLNEANSSLQQEIRREINGVREAAQVAVEQETALRSMITRMEGSYATMQEQAIPLRTLESEATAKRQLLDSLLGRLEEVEAQKDSRAFPAAVKLVSAPQVPHEPSGPFRVLLLLAGFVAALALAIFSVFGLELLQRRIHTPDAVRRILGVGTVHIVPHHSDRGAKGRLYKIFQRHPFSLFSESLRALFRNHLSDLGPVGALAVTSARPQDGKTSLTLAVAQVASQAGRRVVVVDTDFRRSRMEGLFDLSTKKGLSDWIAGDATLDEIVHTSDDVPFAMVPAGKLNPMTLDRFNVDSLVQLMAGLSPSFDLVVFDTAPALAVSDARIVCGAASKVLFVTRWGHTTASDLDAVADLGPIDHSKFVCVMTDVNLKKAASKGYQGPYNSYVATRKYYGDQTLRAAP
ncbi:capsular exopolysaccharide synthesis family protein [Azospirillum brasilense]|uniref:Capsular exopolysaccharide synthesis family protein n=1 Tax=Azospirillum brasilense TaxID=192 RepID=A0A560ANS3_AZOBR|nr:polysaccharide biosynthesis tyrosine autokinase [Azospirillum brasilense]TWA62005.1 capsular exopolysaccharide synthesis family protein [Azospirillum brasilense]